MPAASAASFWINKPLIFYTPTKLNCLVLLLLLLCGKVGLKGEPGWSGSSAPSNAGLFNPLLKEGGWASSYLRMCAKEVRKTCFCKARKTVWDKLVRCMRVWFVCCCRFNCHCMGPFQSE